MREANTAAAGKQGVARHRQGCSCCLFFILFAISWLSDCCWWRFARHSSSVRVGWNLTSGLCVLSVCQRDAHSSTLTHSVFICFPHLHVLAVTFYALSRKILVLSTLSCFLFFSILFFLVRTVRFLLSYCFCDVQVSFHFLSRSLCEIWLSERRFPLFSTSRRYSIKLKLTAWMISWKTTRRATCFPNAKLLLLEHLENNSNMSSETAVIGAQVFDYF